MQDTVVKVAVGKMPLVELTAQELLAEARGVHLDGLLFEVIAEQHPFSGWCMPVSALATAHSPGRVRTGRVSDSAGSVRFI